MIKTTSFLACLFACLCQSQTVFAWGQEGHMVIAQIAYNHLSPAVKAQCDALIAVPLQYSSTASTNFVTAASWADDFKSQLGTGTSHYIDLPLCIAGMASNGICLDGVLTNNAPPGVPNVVTALNQDIAILQDPKATLTNRATAFRYVLHFVGDIQQPLHSANGISTAHPPPSGDGGGNGFAIKGTWTELHALWDAGGGYLNDSGVSRPLSASGVAIITNKANDVEAMYPYTPNIGTVPDPMNWATNSYSYAVSVAYVGITENGTPTTSYLSTASATSKQRMAVGGHALADLLMTIIVTNTANFTASSTNGMAPLTVTFTDTSAGSITNWFWNFGDGNTTNFSASTNPTHIYGAGTYSVTLIVNGYGGLSTNTRPNYITATSCTSPTASVSGTQTICPSGSATIQAALTGTGPWNVTWLDGAGGTNYFQNGVVASPATRTVNPGSTTTYAVTAVSDASGCPGGTPSGSAIVMVDSPATPAAGNNGPICSGGALTLSTPTVVGAAYSWTGPNGFASPQQNPSISNATTAASGTYLVTITDSDGCTSAAGSTIATVNPIPAAPAAGNNGPLLVGKTLNLTASTVSDATYNWTGPNGFTSTDQNPSIPNATSAAGGTYSVTITDANGCTSAAGSTAVLVATLQITSITTQGSDILITWATTGGTTNAVQSTPDISGYNTNFVDISAPVLILGSGNTTTNYMDFGAATNSPANFYRVRLVP